MTFNPNPSPPWRPSSANALKNVGRRLRRIERGDTGLWHYVVDLAPPVGTNKWGIPTTGSPLPTGGSVPPDAAIMVAGTGDPDTSPFVTANGWHNQPAADGLYHPLAFRIHSATQLQLTGVIGLGTLGTTVTVLPTWAWPRFNLKGIMLGTDLSTKFSITISASTGALVVVGEV